MKKVIISVITTAAVTVQLLPPVLAEHGKWIFPLLTAIMLGIVVYFVLCFVEEMLEKRTKESDEQKKRIDSLAEKISSAEKIVANKMDEEVQEMTAIKTSVESKFEELKTQNNTANQNLLASFKEMSNKITADSEIPAKIKETGTEISEKLNDAITNLRERLADNLDDLKASLEESQNAIKRELGDFSHNSTEAISTAIKESGEQNKTTSEKVCEAIKDFSAKIDTATSPIKAAAKLSDEEKKLMETLANNLK